MCGMCVNNNVHDRWVYDKANDYSTNKKHLLPIRIVAWGIVCIDAFVGTYILVRALREIFTIGAFIGDFQGVYIYVNNHGRH